MSLSLRIPSPESRSADSAPPARFQKRPARIGRRRNDPISTITGAFAPKGKLSTETGQVQNRAAGPRWGTSHSAFDDSDANYSTYPDRCRTTLKYTAREWAVLQLGA